MNAPYGRIAETAKAGKGDTMATYLETLGSERDALVARAVAKPVPENHEHLIEIANLLTAECNRLNGFPR